MNVVQYTGTGAASGSKYAYSSTITVKASTTYIVSGFIDATNVTSGSPEWGVYSTDLLTNYLAVTQAAGVSGRVQGSFTTGGAVTQVVLLAHTNNCTVSNGNLLKWWAPQLEQNTSSGLATSYKSNAMDDTAGVIAHTAHSTPVTDLLQTTVNGQSYIKANKIGSSHIASGQINNTHIGTVDQDHLADGTTYQRIRATELLGGSLARTGSGKNLIGNPSFELNDMGTTIGAALAGGTAVCNGWTVNSSTNNAFQFPALDNTFSQSGSQCLLIRAVGGTTLQASTTYQTRVFTAKYPVKVGDVLSISAYVRSDSAVGTLPSGVTMTQRVAYFLYDSTGTHSQEFAGNPSNVSLATGTGAFSQVSNTLTIPATITGGFVPAFIAMQLCGFLANTNATTTAFGTAGNNFDLRFDDCVLSFQNTYKENSPEIQSAIDSSSNLLHTEFTGTKLSTNNEITGWGGNAVLSKIALPPLVAGDKLTLEFQIAQGSAGTTTQALGIADTTGWANGYHVRWNPSTGQQQLSAQVAGTQHNILNGAIVTTDTAYHTFRITITVNGASNNTLECSIGKNIIGPAVGDTKVDLTTGTWFIGVWAGGTPASTKVKNFEASIGQPHHTGMSAAVQTAVDSSGRHIGNLYDGTNSRSMANVTSTIQATGGIDFSSGLHSNKNVDNLADGTTYGRHKLDGLTNGYSTSTWDGAVKRNVKGVGDAQTLSLDSEIAEGTTYQRVKATELNSGTVKQLNDGTNVRTAANVANAVDPSGGVNVDQATSGHIMPRANHHSDFTTAIASGGGVNVDLATSGHIMPRANHHSDFTTAVASGGTVNVDLATSGHIMPRANHHSDFTNAINSGSSLVHNPFGSSVQLNTDGTLSGVSSAGSSTVAYPFNGSSCGYEFIANIQRTTTAATAVGIIIGNTTNGFALIWRGDGLIALRGYSGGTATDTGNFLNGLGSLVASGAGTTLAIDTAVHSFRICVNISTFLNSGNGQVEAYLDTGSGVLFPVGVAAVSGGPTSFFVSNHVFTLLDGNNGSTKFFGVEVSPRRSLLNMSVPVPNALNPTGPVTGIAFNAGTVDTNALQANSVTNAKLSGVTLGAVADSASRFAVSSVNANNFPNTITSGGVGAGTQFGTGGPSITSGSAAPSGAPLGGKGSAYYRSGGTNGTTSNFYAYNGSAWTAAIA